MAPTFIARDDLRKKVCVTFNLIFQFLAQSQTSVFWSCVSRRGTNVAARRLMFKSTVKIRWRVGEFYCVSFLKSASMESKMLLTERVLSSLRWLFVSACLCTTFVRKVPRLSL